MRRLPHLAICALLLGAGAACGDDAGPRLLEPSAAPPLGDAAARTADARLPAVPIGRGPRFQPAATSAGAVAAGRPVRGLRCGPADGPRFGVHLELFAAGKVVVVPAGLGIAGAPERRGAYVRGGGCHYPVRTTEPTGVLEVVPGTQATLGDVFALWDRPLRARRLLSHRGAVRAYVAGRRVAGDPRSIRLSRHLQVVLAVGPPVPVHRSFTFRPGL